MRTLHVLQSKDVMRRGFKVIARTPRGLEHGEVLCEATPESLAHMNNPPGGTIQRVVTVQDENELLRIAKLARDEFLACRQVIQEMKLEMDLVDLEHVFGGERVVIYYIAEDRIDFRELVKRLAHDFQTRIEMKQIGVRDEAKLLADYGDCGKPVCCNTHLMQMPPVSMKMAKLQKASLDPNKISGRCGRLKCCLRYEYDTYEEIARDLPAQGMEVVTQQGRARVLGQEVLAKQLLVQMEDGRRIMIGASEVLSVIRQANRRDANMKESNSRPSNDPLQEENTDGE